MYTNQANDHTYPTNRGHKVSRRPSCFPRAMIKSSNVIANACAEKNQNELPAHFVCTMASPATCVRPETAKPTTSCTCDDSQDPLTQPSVRATNFPIPETNWVASVSSHIIVFLFGSTPVSSIVAIPACTYIKVSTVFACRTKHRPPEPSNRICVSPPSEYVWPILEF